MAKSERDRESVRRKLISLFPRLRRFACILAGERKEADALLRTSCRKMLDEEHRYQRGTPFDRWALAELHAEWLERLRGHDEPILHGRADPSVFLPARPGEGAAGHSAEIADILAKLPPQQRSAILLICGEGFTYEEAAGVLDTPVQTLIARVSRALASFIERADWIAGSEAAAAKVEPFAHRDRRAG